MYNEINKGKWNGRPEERKTAATFRSEVEYHGPGFILSIIIVSKLYFNR
jgi:hypothetical protein